jgi:ATP synthase protein I
MPTDLRPDPTDEQRRFLAAVAPAAARKLQLQRKGSPGVWFGLGLFGLVGWSVALPTVLGGLIGLWWDRRHPAVQSRTLALMVAGLVMGCVNAWLWVMRQDNVMHDRTEDGP